MPSDRVAWGKRALPFLNLVWSGLLDLAYPPRCLVCETPNAPVVCETCWAAFVPVPEPLCSTCGRPRETDRCALCERVQSTGGWAFDGARASGVYIGPLAHAVRRLKYDAVEPLGPVLGAYLANRCTAEELLPADWQIEIKAVIPVPLHPSRLRWRGFNQAELLAAPLADALKVPLETDMLRRTKRTASQVGKTAEQRRAGMTSDAFAANIARVNGCGVLLVDDIFTTGATLNACAGVLRSAGAMPIYAVALAAGY